MIEKVGKIDQLHFPNVSLKLYLTSTGNNLPGVAVREAD